MYTYTISANYRSRKSEYRWLVRRTDEPAEKAIPVKSVNATNVKFVKSNAVEEGFGCRQVAVAENASWEEGPQDSSPSLELSEATIPLAFNGFDFEKKDIPWVAVEGVRALVLRENGTMLAAL